MAIPWEDKIYLISYIRKKKRRKIKMSFNLKNCPKVAGIYKIDFPNGKSYIGLSNNILRRMYEHLTKHQQIVDRAISKYFTRETFEFDILEVIPGDNRQLLLDREFYYINKYDTCNKEKGYNLTAGGNLEGIYNPQAKFSEEDVKNIYSLLRDTNIPMVKISEMYEVSRRTIEEINKGNRYLHEKESYPIRKERHKQEGVKNPNAKFSQEIIDNIIKDLQTTLIEYKDLAKKYNCSPSTIGNICRGTSYKQVGLIYPLRKRNAVLNNKLKHN